MIFPNTINYNPKLAKIKQQDQIKQVNIKKEETKTVEKENRVLTGRQVNDIINRMKKAKELKKSSKKKSGGK